MSDFNHFVVTLCHPRYLDSLNDDEINRATFAHNILKYENRLQRDIPIRECNRETFPNVLNASWLRVYAKITGGYFPDYDILGTKMTFNGETPEKIKFEVKTSAGSHTRNAHFVEVEQSEKPSGLAISKADVYIFYGSCGNIFCMETPKLKALVKGMRMIPTKYVTSQGKVSGGGYVIKSSEFTCIGQHDLDLKRKKETISS